MKWLAVVAVAAGAAHAEPGYFAAVGGGANVGTPFGELELGRRFARAPFLELGLAYSYDRAISELPFQTLGVAVRTYVAGVGRVELFHEASAALALSSSGKFGDRAIGDRLLGPMFALGIGAEVAIDCRWSIGLVVSTGTPVWLRSALAVRLAF